MTTAVSRITIEQDIVELLSAMDAETQLLPIPLSATATAADTTSIRSTTLDRGNPSTGRYDGMIVKIVDEHPEIAEKVAVYAGKIGLGAPVKAAVDLLKKKP